MSTQRYHLWIVPGPAGHCRAALALIAQCRLADPSLTIIALHRSYAGHTTDLCVSSEKFAKQALKYPPEQRPILLHFPKIKTALGNNSVYDWGLHGRLTKIIVDTYYLSSIEQLRETRPGVPIYQFFSGSATSFFFGRGPITSDSILSQRSRVVLQKGDQTLYESATAASQSIQATGETLYLPELPCLYDYECRMNNLNKANPVDVTRNKIIIDPVRPLINGVITCSAFCLEGMTLQILSDQMKTFNLGPAIDPSAFATPGGDLQAMGMDARVKVFLDGHDVGSVFLSAKPDVHHLGILLDTLISESIPFLVIGSAATVVPPHLIQPSSDETRYCIIEWSDTIPILQHPSIGWFMNHGGWNSVKESIAVGIPMIVWPLVSDESINAAIVCGREEAMGFEVFPIRKDKRPSRRGVVIDGCDRAIRSEILEILRMTKGAKGDVVRANVKKMSRKMRLEWETTSRDTVSTFVAD